MCRHCILDGEIYRCIINNDKHTTKAFEIYEGFKKTFPQRNTTMANGECPFIRLNAVDMCPNYKE